ncbi:MAG: M48 family metallopeptidase [Microcoleaceae cyanobacterium]
MNSPISSRKYYRRWIYPLISVCVATSIWLTSIPATQAFSLPELIFHGIRVLQLSTLSDRQEVAIGKQINEQMVGREFKLYRNSGLTKYINDIGQRLANTSDRPDIPYTFQVVDNDQVNAFATMGGFVYVNTGLILAADNEAQLASVMAHEVAHIAAQHAVKQMREMAVAQGLASVAGVDQNLAVRIGVELALRRPHSREAEYEADLLGMKNMAKAGYAPQATIDFLAKLMGKSSPPTFLSTHPATRSRISTLQELLDPRWANRGAGMNNEAYRQLVQRLMS